MEDATLSETAIIVAVCDAGLGSQLRRVLQY